MSEFTLLDWIVLVILIGSIIVSVVRGFIREVLGLATIVVAVLLAAWLHARLARLFEGVLQTETQALLAAFVAIFLVTLVAGFLSMRLLQKFVEFAHIEWFDRLLGGAFGLIRGWLIAAVIFLVLTAFGIQAEAVRSSHLSPYFLPAVRLLAVFTPFDLRARFMIGYEEVERWWQDNLGVPQEGDQAPVEEGEGPGPVPEE